MDNRSMDNRRHSLFTLAASVALALLMGIAVCKQASAASPSPASTSKQTPIRFGVLDDFSGAAAIWAADHKKAVEMALDEIGRKMGGRPVEIYYEDYAGQAATALTLAQRLVTERKVSLIFGFTNTGAAYAVQPYLQKAGIPMLISDQVGATEITASQANPLLYRLTYNFWVDGATMADFAYKQGWRRASLLSLDFSGGYEMSAAFARKFNALGGKIVQEAYAPFSTTDWSPYFTGIDRTADVIAGMGFFASFVTQYRESGLKIPALIDSITSDEMTIEGIKAPAEGFYSFNWYAPAVNTPAARKFNDAFYAKWGVLPSAGAATGYVGVKVLAAAAAKVGGKVENTDAFVKAIAGTNLADTPIGKVRFDKHGMAVHDYYILQVEKKKVKQYEYVNKVVATYKNIDQFWGYTPEQFLALPKLGTLKGTLVNK